MKHSRTTFGMLAVVIALSLPLVVLAAPAAGGEFIRVEVQGKLQHGIMAIGGETTGTIITANGVTWELDLGKNAEFKKKAEKLNGKQALVRGELTRRKGVEIRERWIVKVTSLSAGANK